MLPPGAVSLHGLHHSLPSLHFKYTVGSMGTRHRGESNCCSCKTGFYNYLVLATLPLLIALLGLHHDMFWPETSWLMTEM